MFTKLFRQFFGQKRAVPLAILAIALYTLLAGAGASVVRAALMGSIVLVADGFNRPSSGLASLAGATFAMTLANPGTLWEVGFQLSVAATFGLILYAGPFTSAATRLLARVTTAATADKVIGFIGEFSILTIAAQVSTLPLIAFYLHQVSLISLVANLLVLPVQPQVMILGGLATLGAMVNGALGYVLYWLAWPFVSFTIVVVETLAKVPHTFIPIGQFPVAALFAMYAVLFGLTWLMAREPGQRPRWWTSFTSSWLPNVALGVAAFGALAAWNMALNLPDGKLRVTFFDMGQGDSILIETPSGRYALIDGGRSPGKLAESLGRTLPAGAHTLDLVVTASPAFDSLGGLPGLFDRYTIGRVLLAGDPARTAAYREWVGGVAGRSIPMLTAETGQAFDLGNGITLTVVAALPTGAILRLEDGNSSFLFPVALDAVTANDLATARQIAPATVLLAPSHAGKDSVSASFVAAANPYAVVVSVGAGNANADPQPDTLDLFTGHTVLRTDERGTIVFATDGEQLWVEGER